MNDFFAAIDTLKNSPVGAVQTLPVDIMEPATAWTRAVRFAESEGVAVAAVSESHPMGTFCAELAPDGTLLGWAMEGTKPTELRLTHVGMPLRSAAPAAPRTTEPGLFFVAHYTMGVQFLDPKSPENNTDVMWIPSAQLGIWGADNCAWQYGMAGFEGASAMRNKAGEVLCFRPDQNATRLAKTTKTLSLGELDTQKTTDAIVYLAQQNAAYVPEHGTGKMYIRPYVAGMAGGLGVSVPDRTLVAYEMCAFGDFFAGTIDVEGLMGMYRPRTGADKVAANYAESIQIKKGVKARGYNDYLSFDHAGNVEEVSTCAVGFIDKNGAFRFPYVREDDPNPATKPGRHSLDSITRRSVLALLEQADERVIVGDIHHSELPHMRGMFTLGNAVGVARVAKLGLKNAALEEVGVFDFTKNTIENERIEQLKTTLYDARLGQVAGFIDWAIPVA